MLNLNIVNLVKYPWTAGIIGIIWIGTAVLILIDRHLPILQMVTTDMLVTLIMAWVGFRVEKR